MSVVRAGREDQEDGGKDEEKGAEHGCDEVSDAVDDLFMECFRMSLSRPPGNGPDGPSVRIRRMQCPRADD